MRKTLKEITINSGLILISFLISLLFIELFIRLFYFKSTNLNIEMFKYAKNIKMTTFDDFPGHKHKPNKEDYLMELLTSDLHLNQRTKFHEAFYCEVPKSVATLNNLLYR